MPGKVTCVCGKQYRWKPELAGKRAKCKCGAAVAFPKEDPEAAEAEAKEFDAMVRGIEPHETTPSGAPIYRHEARTKGFEPAIGDEETIKAVGDHIERYIGPVDNVFHEIMSDLVHIDVHVVNPTPERNWYTLVTSGMSDRAMTVPEGAEEFTHAELILCLPPDWPMDKESWEDARNFWPIYWLKALARMPHEYETWLGWGHTVPNGDPAEPYAEDTKLCCMLVMLPVLAEEGFQQMKMPGGKVVNFYALFPLYKEEVDFKLKHGAEGLVVRFEKAGVTEVLNVGRGNTCKKRFGLF
jgi:hypothetical protein